MDQPKIKFLKDVKIDDEDLTIKVRIVKKWDQAYYKNPKQIQSVEMIIIDEEGTRIQANVFDRHFPKFRKHLKEKQCYLIKNYDLAAIGRGYKYINNDMKISLNLGSTLTKIADFGGSVSGLHFSDFASIISKSIPVHGTIDVIGHITICYKAEDVALKDGTESTKIDVEIENLEGLKVLLTLWGRYEQQMSKFIVDNPNYNGNVVVVLQFGKAKWFNDFLSVQNTLNVSKLFINDEIDEILAYKKSLALKSGPSASSGSRGFVSSTVSVGLSEFISQVDYRNVSEVPDVSEEGCVITLATIKSISKDKPWHYLACDKCFRKVALKYLMTEKDDVDEDLEENTFLFCEWCKIKVLNPIDKFKIILKIQDHTGTVSVSMFEREAFKLLNISCSDLLKKYPQEDEGVIVPEEFNILLERKFAFKISINTYVLTHPKPHVYAIAKLSDCEDIISQLETNINNTLEIFEPVAPINSDSANHSKEPKSASADNVTPLSTYQSTVLSDSDEEATPRDKSPARRLKRRLVDNYDDEGEGLSSTTKPGSSTPSEDFNSSLKMKLLTPKLEK